MEEYTFEQLQSAGRKAMQAGAIADANEIAAELDRRFPQGVETWRTPKTPEADFLENLMSTPGKVGDSFSEGADRFTSDIQDPLRGNPVSTAANILRPGLETLGQAGSLGVDAWQATYGQLIPDSIQEAVMNSDTLKWGVELLDKGYDYWQQFEEAYPLEAGILKDAGVVAEVMTPKVKVDSKAIKKQERKQRATASAKSIEERRKGIYGLVRTPASQGRVTESSTATGRRAQWEPDVNEKNIAHTLETFDSVDPDRSYVYNHDVVNQETLKMKDELWKLLGKHHKTQVPVDDLLVDFDDVLQNIDQIEGYHALSTAAQPQALKLMEETRRLISESGANGKLRPRDILKIRQEFDRLFNDSGGNYEPSAANARTFAATQLRNVLNDKLKTVVGDGDVHDLLDRQHEGLKGRDILRDKRDKEMTNMFSRSWHKLKEYGHLPSTPLALYATGATLAGTGVAPVVGGTLAVGTAAHQLYRGMKGPARNKAAAQLLNAINKAGKEDPRLLEELAGERIMLIELLKMGYEEEDGS